MRTEVKTNSALIIRIRTKASHHAQVPAGEWFLIARIASALSATFSLWVLSAPAAPLQSVHGYVPAEIAHLQPLGRVPATQRLNLAIGLPLRDKAGLDAFLKELYDQASPNYHQYLTHEEFTKRFGPTEADYAAVSGFAQAHNLSITGTYSDRMLLVVAGPAAAVESAFHITLRTYHHPTENRDFFAPDTEPSVDATLPSVDVSGLSDYSRPHSNSHLTKLPATPTPNGGSGSGSTYLGNDFRNAYVPGTALTGAGQSVGLFQFDGFYSNDIVAYAKAAGGGRTNIVVQTVLTDSYNGVPTTGPYSGNGEVSLDIEMAMAMAPGLARIVVFEASITNSPEVILAAMVTNTAIKQFSSSWAWYGPDPTAENYFLTMAAQGQSFFNSSGDSDAIIPNDPYDIYPGISPNVTSVGGTVLYMNGSGASYASESVWHDSSNPDNPLGSTGGISTNAIPDWQQGINMVTNQGSTSNRNVPDVALAAKNVYVAYGNGANGNFSGTSCAAPLWAGFMALVNQQASSLGYPSAGFINPAIYAIGKGLGTAPYASAFNDIRTGNNETFSSGSHFQAVAGYDLCTGWGTPTVNLINALVSGISTVFNSNDGGSGSLRSVLAHATNGTTITFASNLSGETILLTNGQLSVNNNLTIDASALTNGVQINGGHNSRIFNVAGGVSVTLNSLILTNGYPGGNTSGGGILNYGTLTLNNCTLAGNTVDSGAVGGGILNYGPLLLTGCTLSSNSAGFAGAINNNSTVTLQNCTFYGNLASSGNGGAIDNASATLSLLHCTFSGNSAAGTGGAIDNYLSQLNVTNSIVAGNSSSGGGLDIYNWSSSTVSLGGSNIVQSLASAGGTVNGAASIISANPLLGPLTNNGGPTWTMLPQANSPAIDAAIPTSLTTDQRGLPRPVGPAPDIGAVEFQDAPPLVTTTADSGMGSLRYAATYSPIGSTITFDGNLSGQRLVLSNGEVLLNKNLTIDASTLTGGMTIDAAGGSRIFEISSGSAVTLNSLVLVNGSDGSGTGGGILNNGTLTLSRCTLSGNSVFSPAAIDGYGGGAIYNQSAATLTLNQCTLTGNSASANLSRGGGIFNYGTLTVNQSTLSSNSAAFAGGAIVNIGTLSVTLHQSTVVANTSQYGGGIDNYSGTLTVDQSTIANNSATIFGGGIYNYIPPATATLDNSIVSANTDSMDADIYNLSLVTLTHANIVLAAYGGSFNGSAISAAPLLGPLGNYGGPTQTMPPLPGSPAIDAAVSTGLTFDQRGFPRPLGLAPDIGAVEGIYNPSGPGLLTGASRLGGGSFYFGFTNFTDSSFTVVASSNLTTPLSLWSVIGAAVESPVGSGQFQFTDPQATNNQQRFYRVRWP